MIRVWVEVSGGARDRFKAQVQDETIERAVHLMSRNFPGCRCRVVFPIDPEAFFAGTKLPLPGRRRGTGR
jgi:hypothetical protein